MPESDGKLTQAETEQVQAWMAKQGTGFHFCPICNSNAWTIGQHIVQPSIGGSMVIFGSTSYPNVMLISPCGYTRYMNAVVMGILPGAK